MLAIYCRLRISGGRQIWKNDFPLLWPPAWDELLRLAADLQSKGIDPFALGAKERWPMQFWFSLAARITRPIAQLTRSAEEISSGNLDTTAAISSSDEIGGLGRIFTQMTARLRGSFAEILSYRDHLEEQVATRTEALSREIAQRREVEQALRVSEEHLRMIIRQAPRASLSGIPIFQWCSGTPWLNLSRIRQPSS